jgi:hypothetical protein
VNLTTVVSTLDAFTGLLQDAIYTARVAQEQASHVFGEDSETAYVLEHEVLPVLRLLINRKLADKAYQDYESVLMEKTG